MFRFVLVAVAAVVVLTGREASAFSLSNKPVTQLLKEHSSTIASLKEQAAQAGVDVSQQPYANDVFFLRYCLLQNDDIDPYTRLASNLEWRTTGTGKVLCDAAQAAIAAATSSGEGGKWNNDAIMDAAPGADKIFKYLTPANIITTTTSRNDLICCIRAGDIDDVNLMATASIDDMVNFFTYAKEINAAVANMRSLETGVLQCVLFANSLDHVKLVGGEAKFRTALSQSSKQCDPLYPCLNGPTLLLNLPPLLGALVKLFTPLFPETVRQRLRFERGPLRDVTDLRDICRPGSEARTKFLKEIDDLVYG